MEKDQNTIDEINNQLKLLVKETKFHRVFLRGLVNGLATAIGATVVFAIVLFILVRVISGIGTLPIIHDIFQSTGIQELIDRELNK